MERIKFTTTINAPSDIVWAILWNDETYRQWTATFAEGSYADTDWSEGSKALFLTADGNGMVSKIKTNIPNSFMSIEHLGVVKQGVEDTGSEEVRQWAGAEENYTLEMVNGKTQLSVEMEIAEDYRDYFVATWPKALESIKALSENKMTGA